MRRGRVALVSGAVGLSAASVVLALMPSGPATANADTYAVSGREVLADLGVCVDYVLTGTVRYDATSLHRLPGVSSHRLAAITLADPTMALSAVTYDPDRRACTTRATPWRSLTAGQHWADVEPGSGLAASSYGPSATAAQYNSGVTPRLGSAFYTNLTRGRPPCLRVSVELLVWIGTDESGRRSADHPVCLTPDFSRHPT